jgi:hypothetical protein
MKTNRWFAKNETGSDSFGEQVSRIAFQGFDSLEDADRPKHLYARYEKVRLEGVIRSRAEWTNWLERFRAVRATTFVLPFRSPVSQPFISPVTPPTQRVVSIQPARMCSLRYRQIHGFTFLPTRAPRLESRIIQYCAMPSFTSGTNVSRE